MIQKSCSTSDRSPMLNAPHPIEDAATRKRRLGWRCRRGMRELDVVLQRYLEARYSDAPVTEQAAFEALLELQDPQLFAYLTGRDSPTDLELVNVVARLTHAGS
jgi:antitoxin CptB